MPILTPSHASPPAPSSWPSAAVPLGQMFTVGIGPSSSHTVGPMQAAFEFAVELETTGQITSATRIVCKLRGSLGATGRGHGTPDAVLAGLCGETAQACDPSQVRGGWERLRTDPFITVGNQQISMSYEDIVFAPLNRHPEHSNALDLVAYNAEGETLLSATYLSVGGGFILREGAPASEERSRRRAPYDFTTFNDLLAACARDGLSIAELVAQNEIAAGGNPQIDAEAIWRAMADCIAAGQSASDGSLPGGLHVRTRAPQLLREIERRQLEVGSTFATEISRIQVDALAVNEENARGNRVVTAPTNGAAGVIPAVLAHLLRTAPQTTRSDVRDFLLTATAVGGIIKSRASISGAQVGCQGEIGSASAMAAGALTAVLGGSPAQVGKAAEMGLEHHLGLTCDPVGGLVQIPCIERNAIAAVTAVQAAALTLNETDASHRVSLDVAIRTMAEIGSDMLDKYKETSTGGLAVNVTEC